MNKIKIVLTIFGTFFFLLILPSSVNAASLQFDPTVVDVTNNQTFDVNLDIDLGSEEALASDLWVSYDSSLLEVVSIDNGSFLSIGKKDFATPGAIYVAAIIESAGDFVVGSGTIATVTFKAIADGTATISYVCVPGETATDSNIAKNNLNADDIIECSENGTAIVTVGSGGGGTGGTDNGSGTGSSGSSASTLPESGIEDELRKFALPAAALVILGVGAKLFFLL